MVKRETEKVDKRMQPGKPIEGKSLLSETEAKKLVPIPKLQVYRPAEHQEVKLHHLSVYLKMKLLDPQTRGFPGAPKAPKSSTSIELDFFRSEPLLLRGLIPASTAEVVAKTHAFVSNLNKNKDKSLLIQ